MRIAKPHIRKFVVNESKIVIMQRSGRFVTVRGKRSQYSDSLRLGRSGDRILFGARFPEPVQTSPGAHPASYTMGTGSVPGVKQRGRGVDHPPHLAPRLKEEYSYTSTPILGLRGLL